MKYHSRTIIWRFKESIELDLPAKRSITIRSPADVFENYRSLFDRQVKERFFVLWLSSANKVIGFEVITEGLLNSSLCHPRAAASIIIVHNHPSGNLEPSQEDIAITKQLIDAGRICGIPVHDHLIIADSAYTSFAERGLM